MYRRIRINTSDINIAPLIGPVTAPRMRVHVGVIRRERDGDAILASIELEKLHVCNGRIVGNALRSVDPLITVLIFNLVAYSIFSIGNLVFAGQLRYFSEVRCPRFGVSCIVIAQTPIGTCRQPERKATSTSFGIDVGTRAHDDVQTQFFGQFEDRVDVMGASVEVQSPVVGCMVCPAGVKREGSEAGSLDLLQNISPQTWDGNTPVVKLAGEDEDSLVINLEAVVVPLDNLVKAVIVQRPWGAIRPKVGLGHIHKETSPHGRRTTKESSLHRQGYRSDLRCNIDA